MNKDIADHFVQMHEEISHGKGVIQKQSKLERINMNNNSVPLQSSLTLLEMAGYSKELGYGA